MLLDACTSDYTTNLFCVNPLPNTAQSLFISFFVRFNIYGQCLSAPEHIYRQTVFTKKGQDIKPGYVAVFTKSSIQINYVSSESNLAEVQITFYSYNFTLNA